jgi:integrase
LVKWTSAKTRNNALVPLRGVFMMAFEDEIIDRNPAAKLKNLKHQKPPVYLFSRDEAELILKTLYERYQGLGIIHAAYFEFAFLRVSGLAGKPPLTNTYRHFNLAE